MPRKIKLDAIDLELLAELQANSRIKNSELARRLGLVESSIAKRIAWLEDHGILQGYTAIVNAAAIDFVDQMAQFRVEAPRPSDCLTFERTLSEMRSVGAIKRMSVHGRYLVRGFGLDFPEHLHCVADSAGVKLSVFNAETIAHEVKALRGSPLAALVLI